MACVYPNCGQAPTTPCIKCGGDFCAKHKDYNHPCRQTCNHPQCNAPATEMCRECWGRSKGSSAGFCATHAAPDAHPCMNCYHQRTESNKGCTDWPKAVCPNCRKAYCDTHLGSHMILKPSRQTFTASCSPGRLQDPKSFFNGIAECSFCKGGPTGQCPNCKAFICEKHRNHHAVGYGRPTLETCKGYKTTIEKLLLLGKIHSWKFEMRSLPLPPDAPDGDICGGSPGPFVNYLFEGSAVALLEDELLSKALEKLVCQAPECAKLDPAGKLALLVAANYLSPLYAAFLRCKNMKSECAGTLESHLFFLQHEYGEIKAKLRPKDWPQKQRSGLEKTWTKKVFKLSHDAKPPPVDLPLPEDVCIIDMTESTWFGAMTRLSLLRKQINAMHQKARKPVWHLSILHFSQYWVFFVNQKNWDGAGTTRVVWPITTSEEIVDKDDHDLHAHQLRVLDLSYNEISSLIQKVVSPKVGGDAKCAIAMLAILEGAYKWVALETPLNEVNETQRDIVKLLRKKIKLGKFRCAFLRGIRVDSGSIDLDERWWMTRKSKSSKDLDELGVEITVCEALCNVMAILFVAEPRHAKSMYSSTYLQLCEVAKGRLTFGQLFGRIGGAIELGRLLPGANVLGPALEKKSMEIDLGDHEPVFEYVNRQKPVVKSTMVKIDRKRLAMPLADSPGHELKDDSPVYVDFIEKPKVACLPEYQPLAKVLFSILLAKIGTAEVPDCVLRVKRLEDTDTGALDRLEEGEKDDGLEDEADF